MKEKVIIILLDEKNAIHLSQDNKKDMKYILTHHHHIPDA